MTNSNPSATDRLVTRYMRWLIKRRWFVLAGTLAAALLLASGAQHIQMDNRYRYFFRDDNPQLQAFEELQNVYTKNDNILFVLEPSDGDAFNPKYLDAVEKLTAEAWKIPFAIRVNSITNYQHSHAEEDDLIVRELVEGALELPAEEIASAKKIALGEPLLRDRLVSPTGHVAAINVTLELPGAVPGEETPAVERARALATQLEADYPEINTYLTGIVMLNGAFFEASMQDMQTLIPLMYLILIITMIVLLRSFMSTFAALLLVGLSVGSAMGFAGWLGIPITAPSSTAPTMILTLAIADSIHILVTLLQKMRTGLEKREALVESMRLNFVPVLLTSLTTAIGFLSLNFSDVRPFNDLGNLTAVGVFVAWLLSITLLPALIAILPIRAKQSTSAKTSLMDRLGQLVIRKRRTVLAGSAATLLLFGVFLPSNTLNDEFVEYFDDSFAFRVDTDFTSENLTGIYTAEFSIKSGETGGIAEPAFLAKLEEFALWYRSQPGVVHVSTITDTMKRLNMNLHGDDPAKYSLPESRELASQYLLLYEMSLPYGLDLNNQIDIDKSATKFVVTATDLSSIELIALADAGAAWLEANASESMQSVAASTGLMFSHVSSRNIVSMIWGTLLAIGLITLVLIVTMRSVRFGLLSVLPNIIPAAAAFGLWGLIVGQVNLGLSMVAAVSLGIVVDDTVHFLSKYLRARKQDGLSPEQAVSYAFGSVGKALVVTSLVLIAGFLILSLSPFALNGGMGQLTSITIAIALFTDLLFLPALLLTLEKNRALASERPPLAIPARA